VWRLGWDRVGTREIGMVCTQYALTHMKIGLVVGLGLVGCSGWDFDWALYIVRAIRAVRVS
jgi:hypothetical protein